MKKNLILTIVAIVLSIATIVVGVLLIVKNFGDPQLSLGNAKGLTGDTVEIPIVLDNNPGIFGCQIIIDYDSDNFSFVSITNGGIFDFCESNDTGDSVAVLAYTISDKAKLENTDQNGAVAKLQFKIKTSATKGEHKIKINSTTNFCNAKEEIVELAFVDGTITVK